MKIIFFGTPLIALPYLDFLHKYENIVASISQPDKPKGRGQKIEEVPVKSFCKEKNFPIFQPANLKEPSFLSEISNLKAEIGMVVAYGKIIPKELINIFPLGLFNIHFSLLPHLRGAAPIQWALLLGDRVSGVTIFQIGESLDTGHILAQKKIEIEEKDDAISLEKKLIPLGIQLLEEALAALKKGTPETKVQTGAITLAPCLKKENYKIHWEKSSIEISRQVRALIHNGAYCNLPNGKILKILKADPIFPAIEGDEALPGAMTSFERGKGFIVKCGIGSLRILELKEEGKKAQDAWSFLQGARLKINEKFF